MDPILGGLLVGGLMGGAKFAGNLAGNENDRKLGATMAKWSPWTGAAPKQIRKASVGADMVPSLAQGLALGASDTGKNLFGGSISPWDAAVKNAGMDSNELLNLEPPGGY